MVALTEFQQELVYSEKYALASPCFRGREKSLHRVSRGQVLSGSPLKNTGCLVSVQLAMGAVELKFTLC